MILKVGVYKKKNNPRKRLVRYVYATIYVGGHSNVVWPFIKERLVGTFKISTLLRKDKTLKRVEILKGNYAFFHTHPCCKCHDGENFSPQDKSLVNTFGSAYCYLGTPKGMLCR